jgi:hypothetical protein
MSSIEVLLEEVKEYIEHADERVVKMVHAMLETDVENDWWERMPDKVKADVEAALKEADEENLYRIQKLRKDIANGL